MIQPLPETGASVPRWIDIDWGPFIHNRLVNERRASLERLMDGWSPERNEELAQLLTRLARELGREPADVGATAGAGTRGAGVSGAGSE